MKKAVFVTLLVLVAYMAWQKIGRRLSELPPLYDKPYIVVYGRTACGWTQEFLRDLSSNGIYYIYKSINETDVKEEILPRMRQAGLDTSRFDLPVVDVNAQILIHPDLNTVLEEYRSASE